MADYDDKLEVTGTLSDNGECIFLDFHHVLNRLRKFNGMKGEKLKVTFSKYRRKRSDAQNRYIWGVVVPVVRSWHMDTSGEELTRDEVYTWLRVGLLGHKPQIKDILGETVIIMTGKRFSKMDTKEFTVAIEQIVQKMAEKGCEVPLPNEDNFITDHVKDV